MVDGFKELVFETSVDFTSGEYYEEQEVPVSLKYEKPFGYCETCGSLYHKKEKCPLTMTSPEKKKETRIGGDGRYEDRACSYRGVVINGNGTHQEKVRETREYHGNGKGKMIEDGDSKRVRKEYKKYYGSRRDYHGSEESSRHRSTKKENTREHQQEGRTRGTGGPRGDKDSRVDNRMEMREEGEFGEVDKSGSSHAFLAELLETQEEVSKVISAHLGENQRVESLLGTEEGMMKEVANTEYEGKDGVGEDFQSLTDREIDEDVRMMEVLTDVPEGEKIREGTEGNDQASGEVAKKQGPRKKIFKSSQGVDASNKMKMAQMMTSKRHGAKPGIRHGDHS
ncbi:hypothetical protein Bca4012_026190 [Brassica carinata]|uniref:Zinc knuckle CX2CX4HX4C domain-containing protein n=2 Tax=Brassica carinata TaxID=52824 RepID=A0A8X7VIQ2_BRACI|nr:hypothetical protein Bca52824_023272 [Brassica carinata]